MITLSIVAAIALVVNIVTAIIWIICDMDADIGLRFVGAPLALVSVLALVGAVIVGAIHGQL